MTKKGADRKDKRAATRSRNITPIISRHEIPRIEDASKRLYNLRAGIEQAISELKRFKRVAMRLEKTTLDTQP